MTERPEKAVNVEESDEEKSVFVVDPDDYQKTRKLKAINDAKDHVRKLRQDRPNRAGTQEWEGIHQRTAEAVAFYGHELYPLIEDAMDRGVLEEDDLETQYGSLVDFIQYDGGIPDREREEIRKPNPAQTMTFYRQLERIQRKLGLGLELQEDKGPAEI